MKIIFAGQSWSASCRWNLIRWDLGEKDYWILDFNILLNEIESQEVIPDSWAIVITNNVYKTRDNCVPEHYRLISVVNTILKLFTSIFVSFDQNIIRKYASGRRVLVNGDNIVEVNIIELI